MASQCKMVEYGDYDSPGFCEKMKTLQRELSTRLSILDKNSLPAKNAKNNVEYIYNPLEYAFHLHSQFLEKYCTSPKKIVFLGMNPGPFGMVQTGIPFGEIDSVRSFLQIEGEVKKPANYHPKRPVEGFNCRRSEVSGKRLWGLFSDLTSNDPNIFFKNCFIYNFCPLALVSATGLNITPPDLKTNGEKLLSSICDEYLAKVIELLEAEIVVGIGRYAEKKAEEVINKYNLSVKVVEIPHPSPRSKGSSNWAETTKNLFNELDLMKFIIA